MVHLHAREPETGAPTYKKGIHAEIINRSVSECDRLIRFLKDRDISAVFHYVPLHSSPAGVKYGRPHGDLRVTDDISSRLLRLPLYYEMTDEHVERVVEQIFHFYQKHG